MKDEELKCQTCGEEECDCGCEDEGIVELTSEDGKKLKFYFVGTIEYKGKFYSAFEPAEQIDGMEEDDLVIFELSGDDEETADLLPVEDEKLLDEVFEEINPESIKDMGKVMKAAGDKFAGRADMTTVSALVRQKLN